MDEQLKKLLENIGFDNPDIHRLEMAKRLLVDRNVDPEIDKLMSYNHSMGRMIRDGKMGWHAEIPGYNSNRFYLGMRLKL